MATNSAVATAPGPVRRQQDHAGDGEPGRIEDALGKGPGAALDAEGKREEIGVVDRLENRVGCRFGVDVRDHRGAQPVVEREVDEADEGGHGEDEVAHQGARALEEHAAEGRQQQELAGLQQREDGAEEARQLLLLRIVLTVHRKDQELGDPIEDGERERVQADQDEQRIRRTDL